MIYHSRIHLYSGKSIALAVNLLDLPESAGFGDIEEQPYEVDPYNTGEIPGTESETEYTWNPYQN